MKNLQAKSIYNQLIADKVLLPRGFLNNWCQELLLSNEQINSAFTHAKKCTRNVFKQVFQYKLCTYILPTNEYLKRYRVTNIDLCSRCGEEKDTIVHRLWECEKIVQFLDHILNEVKAWISGQTRIDMVEFLFGSDGIESEGTNHFFLEAKLFLFYDYLENENLVSMIKRFYNKVRAVIIR